ncbi:MAG: hypothetical protein EXS55_03885 [Candidatus Magasanikbacteria bacterium]|nr:hypothetical protein [Candidatus Magasanikbacteria bacterium]
MKKFLQIFFITLGVIFFVLIVAGVYLYVADPYGIKPLIKSFTGGSESTVTSAGSPASKTNPLLTPAQNQTLKAVGIDPTTLPSKITPEMEQCFYAKLGATRANEIKNGAEPTMSDYFTARSCF